MEFYDKNGELVATYSSNCYNEYTLSNGGVSRKSKMSFATGAANMKVQLHSIVWKRRNK